MPKKALPSPVAALLPRHKPLAPLLTRIQLHEQLLQELRKHVPGSMGNHCLACVLNAEGCLTLYTDTAAWASQLRFHEAGILPALGRLAPVHHIRVRVFLPIRPVQRIPPPPRIPSPPILAHLEHAVIGMEDAGVRHVLQCLVDTLHRVATDP